MVIPRVIPCLLLKGRSLIKTRKFKEYNYIGDPINTARIFNEMEVDEIIFLDIFASLESKSPNFAFIEQLASECFMPMAYGGGIRGIEDAKKLFALGVEKVIINTQAVKNPSLISEIAKRFGSQSVIVSIDVKKSLWGKYVIYILHGTKKVDIPPQKFAKDMEKLGAGEILLNSIDRDGTWKGYDLKLIEIVSQSVGIPVIACGGAGKVEDFIKAIDAGASAVAAGSMFVYQGKGEGVLINYPSRKLLEKLLCKK